MPKIIEKSFDVSFNHEVVLPPVQLLPQCTNRIVRSPHGSVTVTARQKVRFIDRHEDLRHCALQQLVLQRGYA